MNKHFFELFKYGINGLLATAVHYGMLNFNVKIIGFASVGFANLIAACFGIACSFLGNRYFVFKGQETSIKSQAISFGVLYAFIAIFHGSVLFVWSDCMKLDYHAGFLLATFFQFCLSYIGNKKMVFKA